MIIIYMINQTEAADVLFLCNGNCCILLGKSAGILFFQKKEQIYASVLSLWAGVWHHIVLSMDVNVLAKGAASVVRIELRIYFHILVMSTKKLQAVCFSEMLVSTDTTA